MPSPFRILTQDTSSQARTGKLITSHGVIKTPVFMPVATQAVFKGGVDTCDMKNIKAGIILANAYHLYVRRMVDVIKLRGGLHEFMHWDRPILTDSGGFQVWSLESIRKIDDDGVTFTSPVDGAKHRLTPEDAIQIQQDLGADIIMAFDEATSDSSSYAYAKEAMERTHVWAKRCLLTHNAKIKMQNVLGKKQLLFGIIQGGRFKKLRKQSAQIVCSMGFDGVAIGGETIGYNMKRTAELLKYLEPYLPKDKPLYTMGVGYSPTDFFTVVEHGADMFDCVAPARIARHGSVYSRSSVSNKKYRLNLLNAQYTYDFRPICDWCDCIVCKGGYTRGYLRHLFKAEELTALRLATIHNIRFMLKVMEEIRAAIDVGKFIELKHKWQH